MLNDHTPQDYALPAQEEWEPDISEYELENEIDMTPMEQLRDALVADSLFTVPEGQIGTNYQSWGGVIDPSGLIGGDWGITNQFSQMAYGPMGSLYAAVVPLLAIVRTIILFFACFYFMQRLRGVVS